MGVVTGSLMPPHVVEQKLTEMSGHEQQGSAKLSAAQVGMELAEEHRSLLYLRSAIEQQLKVLQVCLI